MQVGTVLVDKKPTKRFSFRKLIKRIFLYSFLFGLFFLFFTGYKYYKLYYPRLKNYYNQAREVAKKSSVADFKKEQTTLIYDSKGELLTKLKLDKDSSYVSYSNLGLYAAKAAISIEDKRFYEHDGVDWKSTCKAGYLYLKNPNEIQRGGSTITQQLIKNCYLSYEKSLERKIKEIFIALEIETKYSKEQILEFYLNNINYANGYYGINSAAKGYFNKEVSKLSLAEVAFLTAIPNNPSLYNPKTKLDNVILRKNVILKEMLQQGYITEDEYLIAANAPIYLQDTKEIVRSYETSYAIHCAVCIFMKKQAFQFRYSFSSTKDYKKYRESYEEAYEEAKRLLYTGGYQVYTSIDLTLQKQLQKYLNRNLKSFKQKTKNGIFKMQGAATVVDNSSGKVLALVGGRSQNYNAAVTLNRAYQSYRQPGSTLKPLAVYTPALESGYTANSIVEDKYEEDGPHNSGNQYSGKITLRTAVEQSKNVVAWNLFKRISPRVGLKYLQTMHFDKILPSDYTLASSLGGLTYGVTTTQMAGAYATLANDGKYEETTCIERIVTSTGANVNLELESKKVYSSNSTRRMTDILQGVASKGTAKGLSLDNEMPIACKTGTTNNQTNGWFCGYTPYYTVSCYVGYDQEKSEGSLWGSTYPMNIWKDIQNYLCRNKKVKQFKKVEKTKKKKDISNSSKNTSHTIEEVEETKPPVYTKEPAWKPKKQKATKKPSTKPTNSPKPSKKNETLEEIEAEKELDMQSPIETKNPAEVTEIPVTPIPEDSEVDDEVSSETGEEVKNKNAN